MSKKKISKIISVIVMILCICTLIYSVYKIFVWNQNNNKNKRLKKKTEEAIKINKEDKITVDFNSLKKQNHDTIAYLKVKGTNIDYVVVKGSDNNYYLNHSFDREYNESGWVFADYTNKFDDTDKNIIIYAHNTMDGSMFGSLKNVLESEWYNNEENHIITLITEKGEYSYKVFSVYQIEAEDYYIQTTFPANNFDKFINNLKERSIYDFKIKITSDDKILTLSTCSITGKERVVVHAKKV